MINEREKYIEQCKEDTVNDIKTRLHMLDLKNNYMEEEEQLLSPSC